MAALATTLGLALASSKSANAMTITTHTTGDHARYHHRAKTLDEGVPGIALSMLRTVRGGGHSSEDEDEVRAVRRHVIETARNYRGSLPLS